MGRDEPGTAGEPARGNNGIVGFVHEVLTSLPRFVDCYNAAINAYRVANHLREPQPPCPDLERKGDWMNAPFWVWPQECAPA